MRENQWWIVAYSGDHSAQEAEWMKTNRTGMMPQQGGISLCRRGTKELGHGGMLGAAPSLCVMRTLFLTTEPHTHSEQENQHQPTTPGFYGTWHLGYLNYQMNAAFAAGFTPSLGVFPTTGKGHRKIITTKQKPNRAKGLLLNQWKAEASSSRRALVYTTTFECPENHYIVIYTVI